MDKIEILDEKIRVCNAELDIALVKFVNKMRLIEDLISTLSKHDMLVSEELINQLEELRNMIGSSFEAQSILGLLHKLKNLKKEKKELEEFRKRYK